MPRWHDLNFATPGWWQSGVGPFGFGYTQTTNLASAMVNVTPTVYLRREFTVNAAIAGSASPLELQIDYDDGFVAYLNGQEVARRNTGAAGSFAWHSQVAFNTKTAGGAEIISLGATNTRLRDGVNVLAIQVHNSLVSNGQLRCDPTLRINGGATLASSLDSWNYFVGTHEPAGGLYDGADFAGGMAPGPDWTKSDYADGSWTLGNGAIGFDTAAAGTEYHPQLGTNLAAQMQNLAWSVYMRREFTITQAQYDALTATSLTVDWDDGYVLYLNGYEISRANLGGAPGSFVPYNTPASNHGGQFEGGQNNPAAVVSIPVVRNLLRVGRNVISAQLHNSSTGSSDLLLDVRFSGTAGSTLTWVGPGLPWRYRIATSEFATPAPTGNALLAPEFLDWIELKNTSATAVDLSGWQLTDDSDVPNKWTFPGGASIPAGGFLVVACSGRNVVAPSPGGMLHTNFSLNSNGEYLALRNAGGVIQSIISGMPDQDHFHTWGLDAGSAQYRYLDLATPGAANVAGTAANIVSEVNFDKATGFHATPLQVALSTNTNGAAIRYTLDGSDPTETSTLYTGPFDPTVTPTVGPGAGTILREMFQWSNGTFVTPANLPSGATPTSSQLIQQFETPSGVSDYYTHRVRGYLHPPATGNYEFWIATDDDGELWLSTTDQPANKVRIAYIQSNWASPREWNKHVTQHSVSIPLVGGQRYYIEALQSEGSGGDNLAVGWSGPTLPAGINLIAGRYLSPPATLPPGTSSPPGAGTVRARAFLPGRLPSEVRTRNYVTGIDARLTTVPAFFLSGPAAETFYNGNGMFSQVGGNFSTGSWQPGDPRFDYNFCLVSGDAFERPAALEIVNPGNQIVERTTVGARFAGSPWSRPQYQLQNAATSQWNSGAHNKPQVNLFFRGDFGASRLRVDGFIPTSRLREWDTLRLRAGKNDAYNPFIIDEWMRQSFAATGAPSPQGMFATLFINGQFKSYFNPCERPRGSFFQDFYGSGNDFDVNYIGSWEEGDTVAFNQMNNFFRNNDFTSPANYQTGETYWDMANVADYVIVNGWGATQDWPHNNYTFLRERAAGAKWRWSMWDAEGAMGMFGQANSHNTFENELHVSSANAINSEGTVAALVFRRAHQNPEFRLLFADRLQKHFFNGGAMTRTVMNARWNALRSKVEPLVLACFGGSFNNNNWNNWANRDATFLAQARTAGLWPVTQAPTVSPFGGAAASASLSNPNGSGTIYYTTDGSDPRAVGGAVQGTAYSGTIAVAGPFALKARVRSTAGEWSPLVEADFVPAELPRVVISE
ncbi:MAG TPA: chitobiase/beta-hexosaminidase C-terminal domain-containing protein, partial [Chthoniobacteraceae bacterium]|nr:chitobiase/beta-hexosaminidase C-terminal domain-containing protein [Chthoniobacteraceae bacterium]